MGSRCTVGGNYLFSCEFNFPKSSFSLVLHQVVQFHAVQQMGLKQKKKFRILKETDSLRDLWDAYLQSFCLFLPVSHLR